LAKKVSVVFDDDEYMKILDFATRTGIRKVSTAIRFLTLKALREVEGTPTLEDLHTMGEALHTLKEEIKKYMKEGMKK